MSSMRLPTGASDDDLVATVIHVHERVRARLQALRGGKGPPPRMSGYASGVPADMNAWDHASGVLRRLGLHERDTAPEPSVRGEWARSKKN